MEVSFQTLGISDRYVGVIGGKNGSKSGRAMEGEEEVFREQGLWDAPVVGARVIFFLSDLRYI